MSNEQAVQQAMEERCEEQGHSYQPCWSVGIVTKHWQKCQWCGREK